MMLIAHLLAGALSFYLGFYLTYWFYRGDDPEPKNLTPTTNKPSKLEKFKLYYERQEDE